MNFYSFIVEFLFSISFDFNSCSNLVYFDLIQVNFDVKFQKKNQEKCEEPFKSKAGEQSKGNRALQFKVRNFRTMESNMRKFISRCEFLKPQFRTPLFKVRKFSYRAKLLPGTQVPFRTPQGHFRTVRIKVRNSLQCAK